MTMSTHIKIADAIRDYYEMLEQLSSEELEQLIPSVLKLEGNAINQEQCPTPPFCCQTKTYSD